MALDLGELVAKMRVDRSQLGPGLARGRWEIKAAADSISDDVEGGLGRSGDRGVKGLVGAVAGGMSALGPAIMPILATVGASAGLALGAGIAAAVILAVPIALAGGVLAAGIMAAARDPAVGAAFAPLKTQATKALAEFAEPFKGPLIRAATTFGNALAQITPYLRQMGQAVAPLVDQLAPALAKMAVAAMPGLLSAVRAGVPLISGLIRILPNLGSLLSRVLGGIAGLVPWALRVGGAFAAFGGFIARVVIPPLRQLVGSYLAEGRTQIAGVSAALRANAPQLQTFVRWVGQAAMWVGEHLVPVLRSQLVANLRIAGGAIRLTIAAVSAFVTAIQKIVGAVQRTASAVKTGVGQIKSFFSALPGQIMSYINSLPGRMYSAGVHIISSLASGMASQARAAVDKVRGIVGEIASLIPGSPVKAGPLRSLNNGRAGRNIVRMLMDGISAESGGLRATMARALVTPGAHRAGGAAQRLGYDVPYAQRRTGGVTVRFQSDGDPWTEALRKTVRVVGGPTDALGSSSPTVAIMG